MSLEDEKQLYDPKETTRRAKNGTQEVMVFGGEGFIFFGGKGHEDLCGGEDGRDAGIFRADTGGERDSF